MSAWKRAAAATTVLAGLGAIACAVLAQPMDAKRPRTFVVGPRHGGAQAERVDWGRTGLARTALPSTGMTVQWRRALGAPIDHAPLVDETGAVFVVFGRGEVVSIAADGSERWRASTSSSSVSPAALLSDGTVAFVGGQGEAIGVRRGLLHFRTRLSHGDGNAPEIAPLALDDGGVVVASGAEIVALDAEGNIRTRAPIPEPLGAPLIAALGKVYAVGSSGAVYQWSPGRDPMRIGSFGASVDGAAALVDDHTLLAVTQGVHLTALDLVRGVSVPRATASSGFFLGPPAVRGGVAYLLNYTSTSSFALALDATGQELRNVLLTNTIILTLPDGGTPPLAVPAHRGPLVDTAGTMAFSSPEGQVGIVTNSGGVEILPEYVCTRGIGALGGGRNASASLSPAEDGSFVVGCASGALVKVTASKQL